MTPELLSQIQILNEHIAELTVKSQELVSVLKHSKGLDINTVITAIVGLLGVGIGSCISYQFSKKITNESSKARFAIQRKNLIYSKIYKELIYMREQIDLLPDKGFYFQLKTNLIDTKINNYNIDYSKYWIAGKYDYIAPVFCVWKDIKSDVRITQVNHKVRVVMTNLENAVINYFNSLNEFEIEFDKRNTDGNINSSLFFFIDSGKESFIREYIQERWQGQTVEWYSQKEESFFKIINPLSKSPLLKNCSDEFFLLKEKLDEAYFVLEQLITEIVNKYEYGEEI